MVIAALARLGCAFPRLLWESNGSGAIDLKSRYVEVQRWFTGLPVYGVIDRWQRRGRRAFLLATLLTMSQALNATG